MGLVKLRKTITIFDSRHLGNDRKKFSFEFSEGGLRSKLSLKDDIDCVRHPECMSVSQLIGE